MMTLNKYLDGKFYLVGDNVTIADIMVAAYLIVPMQTIFDGGYRKAIPHVTEWFERITSLPSFVKSCGYVKLCEKAFKQWDPNAKVEPIKAPADNAAKGGKGGDKKGGKGKKEEPKKKDDDDDFDLFGDDDDDGAAAAVAAKAKAEADKKKKKKKVVIAMSLVLLEVKPLDDKTDLDKLAKYIFENLTQEGLYWKTEYKKEPVAFGIFKLIIGFSLEDEKVSVDDVVDKIEALDDQVQSVEIQAFNKI
jgi:translation elongation factor EF-1beta